MGFSKHGARVGVRPVELSADDEYQFDRLASSLLDDALYEYDYFVTVDRRQVNLARWKHWKQDDDVVVFRERYPSDPANESLLEPPSYGRDQQSHSQSQAARFTAFSTHGNNPRIQNKAHSKPNKMPRLLAIGSLSTTLDDVLYGIVTPTGSAMRLKASYLETDDFLDGTVLAQIRAPTTSEPFQFLGIKWMLQRGMGGGLGLVRPRDFVFLESSGVRLRQDGSGHRVGFHIMHSVDLPQCSSDSSSSSRSSVQRGAFSTCYLYHEYASGSVDVYMTAMVQPRGNIIAPIALRSAAAMLRSNWRLLSLCAENKKLLWLLETHRQLLPVTGASTASVSRCGLCSKSFKGFTTKKKLACQLCSMTVCVHCSMSRTLRSQGLARTSSVASEKMLFCKKCIAMAGEESASEIARQQLWEDEVVRTGRAHTQTALALVRRETSNGSRLHRDLTDTALDAEPYSMMAYHRPEPQHSSNHHHGHDLRRTWHDSDHSRQYHIYDQPSSTPHTMASTSSPDRASLVQRKVASHNAPSSLTLQRRTNGTWNSSMRATEATSLGLMDFDRTSSYQEPTSSSRTFDSPIEHTLNHHHHDDDGRASTTSSALVLLDNRKSTRQMKALDYLPPTEAEAALATLAQSGGMSLASSALFTEVDDGEVESVYSRTSFTSSIAVLDLEAAHAAQPLATATTIVEEEEPSHGTHSSNEQTQHVWQSTVPQDQYQQLRQPSFQDQRPPMHPQQQYEQQQQQQSQQHRTQPQSQPQPQPQQRRLSPADQQQPQQRRLSPADQQQPQQRRLSPADQQQPQQRRLSPADQQQPQQRRLSPADQQQPQQRRLSPADLQQQPQEQARRLSRVQFHEPGSSTPSRDSILRNPRASELLRRSTSAMAGSEVGGRRSTATNEGSEAGGSSVVSEQRLSYQMQLWLQMNELRDTAESTYQITQRNAQVLASQNPQAGRSMRFFSQQPIGGLPTSRPVALSMPRAQQPPATNSFVQASGSYPRRYTNVGTPTNR